LIEGTGAEGLPDDVVICVDGKWRRLASVFAPEEPIAIGVDRGATRHEACGLICELRMVGLLVFLVGAAVEEVDKLRAYGFADHGGLLGIGRWLWRFRLGTPGSLFLETEGSQKGSSLEGALPE
jgi:hypothetical protein